LLADDSYLLEGLQSADKTKTHAKAKLCADKTKTHPKAKLQNAPTFTGNSSHSHVSTNDIHGCTHKLYFSDM